MEYAYGQVNGELAVTLSGRLVYADAAKMHDIIAKWDFQSQPNVRLNLRYVTFLDSTAIGTLFVIAKHAAKVGGELILLNPSPSVAQILERAEIKSCARVTIE